MNDAASIEAIPIEAIPIEAALVKSTLADSVATLLNNRRSVRAFLPDAVPETQLHKIFTLAQRAPSNCNTQPWVVHVVSGEKLEVLRQRLPQNTMQGKMSLDFPYNGKYDGAYRDRQYDAANQMYGALNIPREEKQRRMEVFLRNYSFFGAPHVAFLFLPESFGLREAADIGMYAQSLMLTLTAHGLASCPQTSLGFHADEVRKALNVEANYKLLFGISFGYEDTANPINTTRVGRAALEETTVFHA